MKDITVALEASRRKLSACLTEIVPGLFLLGRYYHVYFDSRRKESIEWHCTIVRMTSRKS